MTADQPKTSIFASASKGTILAARLCFSATVVLIPVRFRILLETRPLPGIYRDYTNFLFFATDIAVLLMLGLWAASWCLSPRQMQLGPRSVWIPLAGLTLAGWASIFVSLDPHLSVYHAIRMVILFWFYLFIVNEVHSLIWVWVPVALQIVSQSVVALAQFLVQRSVGLQSIGEPLLDPALPGVSVVAADGMRLLRAYGLSDHPNILGGCLAFGLLLLLSVYLHDRRHWIALAAVVVGGLALLLTFSRSAWLALLFGAVLLLMLDLRHGHAEALRRWLTLGLVSCLAIVPVVIFNAHFFGVRLNAGNSFGTPTAEQQSIGERLLLIDSAAIMISRHPLLGIGLGAAPQALKIVRPDWPVAFEPPHSSFVDAALETGLLGAVFYIALLIAPFIIYFRRPHSLVAVPLAGTAIALLLAIAVVGFFDYYTWLLAPGRLWQWLAWGLWAIVLKPGERTGMSTSPAS